ncbi:MAG: DUF3592 domain-containing protein [Oscillospiraceae bacterium]|nr:DUF3592 domain-containing protein [Oscillospiraceae bacterium]
MRIRVILVLLVPAVLLLLTVRTVLRCIRMRRLFRTADAAAEGTVTKVRAAKLTRTLYSYTVSVRYEADGKTFETKHRLPAEESPECPMEAGSTAEVRYRTGHPETGFMQGSGQSSADLATITALCAAILLFLVLLCSGSLVRYPLGWFTVPERRLLGIVRLTGIALFLLAFAALGVWTLLIYRRAVPLTGTVLEVRKVLRQTILRTECEMNGEYRTVDLPKDKSDKREFSVGDRIELRCLPQYPNEIRIYRKKRRAEIVLGVITGCFMAWQLADWLAEDLLDVIHLK